MTLAPGTKLGPYEILSPLGAGGMGEVWKAKDARLDRFVAVKVLPEHLATHPEALARFEREAKAVAALNHPNIMALHDLGNQDGVVYEVMELLEGESLRATLAHGPLAPRTATELAVQLAHGLAAAHEKGVIHRDLKPDNLWITKEGRLKILDFGLAKQVSAFGGGSGSLMPTEAMVAGGGGVRTEEGMILGTVGYMSPEQVRGEAVDARSDLFSFGVVLFEMLTGKKAFARDTTSDTLAAILRDDPPELEGGSRPIPPALRRIIDHCLEKLPARRFHDATDLAFALESAAAPSSDSGAAFTAPFAAPSRRRPWKWAALVAVGGALLLAAGAGLQARFGGRSALPLSFKRLTFGKGTVEAARFTPGSQEILYTARWQGQAPEIFAVHPDSLQPRSLGIPDAALLAVSPKQELLVMTHPRLWNGVQFGPLARAVPGGGALREVAGHVLETDWLPGAEQWAVLKATGTGFGRVIEFPKGRVVHETAVHASQLRVSPSGDRIAFLDRPSMGDGNHRILVIEAGGRTLLTAPTGNLTGLAWAPGGKEIWYSEAGNEGSRLWALDLSGRRRLLLSQAGWLELRDVGPDGRALVTMTQTITGVMGMLAPEFRERDLSWNEATRATEFTPDGQSLLIGAPGTWAADPGRSFYLRKGDGSPALRLGEASAFHLFPDGRRVLAVTSSDPMKLAIVPVGPGETRELSFPGQAYVDGPYLFPDGKRAACAVSKGGEVSLVIVDLETGATRPVGPSNTTVFLGQRVVSPDGRWLVLGTRSGDPLDPRLLLVSVEGGEPRPVQGTEAGDIPLAFDRESKGVLVFNRDGFPTRIHRLDLATGRRELVREITPVNPAGLSGIREIVPAPDGRGLAYNYVRKLSDLYLIEGLK
ncbi:MAG: protein kinase [Holophagaceae bacterium]|nr:protein kinase [Holophagaceae bacterium]